jgi:hypothetical protein
VSCRIGEFRFGIAAAAVFSETAGLVVARGKGDFL